MKTVFKPRGRVPPIVALAALASLSTVRAQATWRPMPDLSPRSAHAMAYDPVRQRVVMFGGGYRRDNMADTWEWDGKHWELMRPLVSPSPRFASSMAYDPVRKTVILFGGWTGNRVNTQRLWLSETWEWDGRIWSQLKPATSPMRRSSPGMATDWARSRIVMFGGFTDVVAGYFERGINDTWEWDGVNWTQRLPKTIPPARGTQSFAFNTKTRRIAMFGGHNNWSYWFTDTWEWDGKDWISFSPLTSPPRAYTRMEADPVTGGTLLYSATEDVGSKPGTWRWDGQSWTDLGQALNPGRREGCMLASDSARRQVVLFGGYDQKFERWRDTWSWDGKVWKKVHDWPFPEEVWGIGVYDGARDEFVVLQPPPKWWLPAKTWVMFNGVFRRLYPATSPPIYGYNALLYHPVLKKVFYLYGDGQKKYIWLWDGKSWTQTSYQTGPDGRNAHLAWDGHQQKVMEYDPKTGELWEWDPKGWVRLAATSPPPRRSSPSFGYDPARRRLVLFGGYPSISLPPLDDTWEWDGTRWQKMSPKTRPQAREAAGMAYVPALGGMVLFAGRGIVGPRFEPLGDTWLWDGKDWTKLPVPLLPAVTPLSGEYNLMSATYDAGRQRLVAFYAFASPSHPAKCMWEFFFESLTTMQPYLRPGESFKLQIHLPGQAGKIFMLAFSTAVRPGIPLRTVPGLGVELLPLSPDALFWSSLGLWMLTQLDAKGNGTIPMAVPNNQALLGLKVHAAGGAVDLKNGVTAITNDLALKIVK